MQLAGAIGAMLYRLSLLVLTFLCLAAGSASAAGSLVVAWDPNSESDLSAYIVRYGTSSGTYSASITVASTTTTATIPNLTEGVRYYVTVQAVNTAGLVSEPAAEVNGVVPYTAATSTDPDAARVIFGLGPGGGGWMPVIASSVLNFGTNGWTRVPWDAYNTARGETHIALGDVDGDGLDEVVIGLGAGGGGWICVLDDAAHGYAVLKWIRVQWDSYNAASGAVYPAAADIDGDGRAEIVAGLGRGGAGWYETFDDASAGFAHLAWGRFPSATYNAQNGELHPALGDFDGDGRADLALGGGAGSAGSVAIAKWNGTAWVHQRWLAVTWAPYNAANGTVWPAAGDLDGDGRAELVLGLGTGGAGWLEVRDDETAGFASSRWLRVDWPAYWTANGETHPAIGNLDADTGVELLIGLGVWSTGGGWYTVLDDAATGYAPRGWRQIPWDSYNAAGGPTFPAIGRLR